MYTVFTRLVDGELLLVASRDNIGQAVHLALELKASWPREYVVRDPHGNSFNPEALHMN